MKIEKKDVQAAVDKWIKLSNNEGATVDISKINYELLIETFQNEVDVGTTTDPWEILLDCNDMGGLDYYGIVTKYPENK